MQVVGHSEVQSWKLVELSTRPKFVDSTMTGPDTWVLSIEQWPAEWVLMVAGMCGGSRTTQAAGSAQADQPRHVLATYSAGRLAFFGLYWHCYVCSNGFIIENTDFTLFTSDFCYMLPTSLPHCLCLLSNSRNWLMWFLTIRLFQTLMGILK